VEKRSVVSLTDRNRLNDAADWHDGHLQDMLGVRDSRKRGSIADWFVQLRVVHESVEKRESFPDALDDVQRQEYRQQSKMVVDLADDAFRKGASILKWFGLITGPDGSVFRDRDVPKDSLLRGS
jgi:hypothetical protein